MIETFASLFLKLMGLEYLRPYVRGLIHIGRPSDVHFPKELIGQGLSLVLSGLNNTMAFQSNPDWVWPAWYERQKDPDNPAFIPTGMNLITSNLAHRNWTSIGVMGESWESMVDNVGMVSSGAYGWSVFPYVRYGGNLYVPTKMMSKDIRQSWYQGASLLTEYRTADELYWSETVTPVKIQNEILVVLQHRVQNKGERPIDLVLGVTLRPYNPLSIAHIHKIKYKANLWRINQRAALWLLDHPGRACVFDRNSSDPLNIPVALSAKDVLVSRSGIACGIAEYDLKLAAGESKDLYQVMTIKVLSRKPIHYFRYPDLSSVLAAVNEERNLWENRRKSGARIWIPEKRWQEAWDAIRCRFHVFDDGTHFSPGTYLYHHFWLRDHAFLSLAAMTLGDDDALVRMRKKILQSQRPEGHFITQDGEWDGNGQAVFCLANAVFASGDLGLLEEFWPKVWRSVQWINRQRQHTRAVPSKHYGLLPAGFSAEHFGPNDHYFWDNFWNLRGLQDAIWMAQVLGKHEAVAWMTDLFHEYQKDLDRAIEETLERTGFPGLPSSPYRKFDASAIGCLSALSPLGVKNTATGWIFPTADALWSQCVYRGMFFQSIVHTGLNAYLSLQLARIFLLYGDMRWKTILNAVLDFASPTWTWPEAIHPQTRGGCMGDGDHGWAAAEYINLLAMLMVRVQDDELILAGNLPMEWFHGTMDVGAAEIVTRHGRVSWRMRGHGERVDFSWNIERNRSQKPLPVYVMLPKPMGLDSPVLSSFEQGRQKIRLHKDQGHFMFPVREEI